MSKADNRLGAALVLGGAAVGAGVGAIANDQCSRSSSAWIGAVRGLELVGVVGGIALASYSKRTQGVGLAAAGAGAIVLVADWIGLFNGVKNCA